MKFGVWAIFALVLACCSIAQAQTPEQQRVARVRLFGSAEDVRWHPETAPAVFASDTWNMRVSGATVENRGLRHVSAPVWTPLSSGPCRTVFASPIPQGIGSVAAWQCPLNQPIPYFFFSFEARPNEHAALVPELTQVDVASLGVQAPQCHDVTPIAGVDVQSWCESTFTQGAEADSGRLIVVVGSTRRFFFKATTACAGAQCAATRDAMTALLSEVRIGPG